MQGYLNRAGRMLATTIAVAVLATTALVATSGADPADASTTCDALCTKVRSELKVFTDWLATNKAKGWIGEVGWDSGADAAKWNALADIWFNDADRAGLWATSWATGEWWPNTHVHSVYSNVNGSALDTARSQAAIVEKHGTTSSYQRGINLNGGEFGAPSWSASKSSFSNANPGTYNSQWHYDGQGTFDFLASRGVKLVRLPFRWERVQPTLGGGLDANELSRITAAIDRAGAAGIKVIPQVFNYGGYMKYDGTQGVRATIGTAAVTYAHFEDLWKRLSTAWKANANVAGYGLMNEPASMTAVDGLTSAQVWEKASQRAVTAIRNNSDNRLVLVPGYNWSGAQRWNSTHPKAWISDSAANIRYEAHHYWDSDNAGSYGTYADELADAEARGYKASTIETTSTDTTANFSGNFTSTNPQYAHKIPMGAGSLTATLTLSSTTAKAVLVVADSANNELGRHVAYGTAKVTVNVPKGTNKVKVKGPQGTSYTLSVTHPLA